VKKNNRSYNEKFQQKGAALLIAMLTVAIVATFSSAALWYQWRAYEVEKSERQRLQVEWMLTGALDWSKLILREDARTGLVDHMGEPWALVLEESRLSTFLAADKNNTAVSLEETLDAFLSGNIVDAQRSLNVNNLIRDGKISEIDKASFKKLFIELKINPLELDVLCDNLLASATAKPEFETFDEVKLRPQRARQLNWLGLNLTTIQKLEPFITLLPNPTTVNVNTASAEVLYATIPKLDMPTARQVIKMRENQPFENLNQLIEAFKLGNNMINDQSHSVGSNYFFVIGRMRIEQTTIEEVTLISRKGRNAQTIWRDRGVLTSNLATNLK
jgi:general secretion pathway protein K